MEQHYGLSALRDIARVLELTVVSVISMRVSMQSPLSVSRKANQGLFFLNLRAAEMDRESSI